MKLTSLGLFRPSQENSCRFGRPCGSMVGGPQIRLSRPITLPYRFILRTACPTDLWSRPMPVLALCVSPLAEQENYDS